MDATAIHTYNLTRKFGVHHAVDRLTLDVPAGIIFGLLGPKGAGKTTTLRLLLGLLPPTAGSAHVLGYDVRTQASAIQTHTGALLQPARLENGLSSKTILAKQDRSGALALLKQQSRYYSLLTHFDLWALRQEAVETWSLERQRRLAIVRALLHRPALLFLDEPTTGLDTVAAASLRQALVDFVRREGMTVFLATDNMAEAIQVCDMVGILHRGKLLMVAPPHKLQTQGAVQVEIRGRGFTPSLVALLGRRLHVTSVRADGNHLWINLLQDPQHEGGDRLDSAPLVTLLIESGAEVEEVHKQVISLEELYATFAAEGP